jgi:hypothetical protein
MQSALEEPGVFERVDDGHHRAGWDVEGLRQCLLGLTVTAGNRSQEGELSRLETHRGDDLAEAP